MEPIIIEFKGKKSFNTIEEAERFKKKLGDRYLRTWRSVHPDMTFYVVEYKEE